MEILKKGCINLNSLGFLKVLTGHKARDGVDHEGVGELEAILETFDLRSCRRGRDDELVVGRYRGRGFVAHLTGVRVAKHG